MLITSILLEATVALLAVLAARKGRRYAYGFALTFAIYVVYDAARLAQLSVQAGIFSLLFLLATISAVVGAWGLYRE